MTRIRRTARTGRRALGTLVVVALTAAGLMVIVPSLLGFHLYAIATGSMTGTLDVGTLAISREVPVEQLAVGDIITYVPPPATGIGHPVTHRIVEIDAGEGPTMYVTKGDANETADPWDFSLDSGTQARVERQVPYLGQPVLALTDPRTRFLAIGIPALAIAVLSLRDLWLALRPVRSEDEDQTATEVEVITLPEAVLLPAAPVPPADLPEIVRVEEPVVASEPVTVATGRSPQGRS